MSANDMQVGGDHYKGEYQHWDLALTVSYSYLEGCATKYVTRWRKKDGVEDLRKALHCLNKLQEDGGSPLHRKLSMGEALGEIKRFGKANVLGGMERQFCWLLATWTERASLYEARDILLKLLDEAEAAVEKPHPVPLTEENHHAERVVKDTTGW